MGAKERGEEVRCENRMQMLLRQGQMDGWMDGLRERERDAGQVAQTHFFFLIFGPGQSHSLDDGAEFALMDLLSMRCHVSVLHGHITPRPLIKSRPPSAAICPPDASHLSPAACW